MFNCELLSLRWFLIYKAIKTTGLLLLLDIRDLFFDDFDVGGADELSDPDSPLLKHADPVSFLLPPLPYYLLLLSLEHLGLSLGDLFEVVRGREFRGKATVLVQGSKVFQAFFKYQRIHVVIGLLKSLVVRSQYVLRGDLVFQRRLTCEDLVCIELLSLSY